MKKFKLGKIYPCSSAPELTSENIIDSKVIVAQMGMEPFLQVLESDPTVDIILSGRSYDPAPFAAWCIFNGVERSTAYILSLREVNSVAGIWAKSWYVVGYAHCPREVP